MNTPTPRPDPARPQPERTAATPDGNDTLGKLEEREQRTAEERSHQAVENQGAQGRKPDPAPGVPAERRPRR